MPSDPRHPWPTRALHWLTVALLLASLGALWWRDGLDEPGARAAWLNVHRQLGLLVWLALWARLLARLMSRRVDASAPLPWFVKGAAWLCHGAMYVLLFAQPLVGWAMSNARSQAVTLFGLFTLPSLQEADPDLAELWVDRHALLAWGLGGLVAVHIMAALWHRLVLHDGVWRSMMPGRAAPPNTQESSRP